MGVALEHVAERMGKYRRATDWCYQGVAGRPTQNLLRPEQEQVPAPSGSTAIAWAAPASIGRQCCGQEFMLSFHFPFAD